MRQIALFTELAASSLPVGLVCAFGRDWLDHFAPPIGTSKGCIACDTYEPTPPPLVLKVRSCRGKISGAREVLETPARPSPRHAVGGRERMATSDSNAGYRDGQ
jgi:hypothetical protein